MEAYSVAGNSIHANGEQIERRYHSACFSKPPGNGHMHQCLEKLNHIFPATEASMFHVKHPPPTRKTKTQNTTPLQQKQPTFHVKQLGCCRNVVFHVKYRSLFSYWENPSTTTGGKSERTCYLACLSLLTETSHVWGRWISFIEKLSNTKKHDCRRKRIPLQALPMFHVKPPHHHKTKKNETAQLP